MAILLKSVLHNIGVVLVGIALAYLGKGVDSILGFPAFTSTFVTATGWLLVAVGFLLRVWATFYFYSHILRVFPLHLQSGLLHRARTDFRGIRFISAGMCS